MPKRRVFANAAVTSAEHTHSLHIDSAARPVKRTRTEALDPRSSDRTEGQTSYSSVERPATAPGSFFSSGVSSNSGSPRQPGGASTSGSTADSSSSGNAEGVANVSARSSSAAQPVTLSQSKISSMWDVQRWLAEQPIVRCHSADMERLKEAAAVLSRPKPRKEDVRELQNDWQGAQMKHRKPIPLPEVIQDFRGKIIKAAQKLQQQLLDSAEPPASDDPMLRRLKDRQSKRAQDSAAEEQRPLAKPKATKGRNKRAADSTARRVKRTRAARPAQDSAAQSQPAVLSSVGLQECSHWLQSLPEDAIAQSLPLKRVHSATALLLMPSTGDQRQRIQKILEEWHVSQKHKGNKRVFKEVKAELVSKVVEESKRLKTMHKVIATAIPAAPPLPPWATYSAIQASLQNRNSSSAASPKPSS